MIIAVSIVDKHRPTEQRHIGTYIFEIDYPASMHPGQMDFLTIDCPIEGEAEMRPFVGRLLSVDEMPDPVHGDGTPLA